MCTITIAACTPPPHQVHEQYAGHEDEWRHELRVRYIPTDLHQLFERDKVTFYYYYDQVRGE